MTNPDEISPKKAFWTLGAVLLLVTLLLGVGAWFAAWYFR